MSARGTLQPRRKPSQERARVTVEAILEAAAQVFARHGYAAGTTNRIAERAGVSIGTLYQYFPNKDAILVALIERHLAAGELLLRPLFEELVERPPRLREGIERMLHALLELHASEPALHRVLFEEAPRPPWLRARLERSFAQAADALAAYFSSLGEVTVADPRLAGELVAQCAESITHGLVIHPRSDVQPQRYVVETALMLERYLTG